MLKRIVTLYWNPAGEPGAQADMIVLADRAWRSHGFTTRIGTGKNQWSPYIVNFGWQARTKEPKVVAWGTEGWQSAALVCFPDAETALHCGRPII